MTTIRNIEDDLTTFIQYQALGGRPVAADTDLLDEDILDSLLLMDLLLYVESTYEIRLDDTDISPQHFRTIEAIARLVQRQWAAARTHTNENIADADLTGHLVDDQDAQDITHGTLDPRMLG